MDEVIYSGKHSPGDVFTLTNEMTGAVTYRADFGVAGAIRFTLPPGFKFEVIFGTSGPQLCVEHVSPPGLRGA
jgi:hypothetical protein